ncbi:hypothetical protein K7X08_016929 [Anisodus acutangulus]|uniref:Uncharacterized protein n=1 Tax=Anisodus acutangulus TaxID=402998 RepID=A0A9Q1LUD0_9SOLA|nr:hypothetical protein K7X08_016929 [Anisodus acutangulus]
MFVLSLVDQLILDKFLDENSPAVGSNKCLVQLLTLSSQFANILQAQEGASTEEAREDKQDEDGVLDNLSTVTSTDGCSLSGERRYTKGSDT